MYLYVTDVSSGESTTTAVGRGPLEPPLVVGDMIYVNRSTTEGDPILTTSGGVAVSVGDAPVRGLGVVDGRLLVMTSSDGFGAQSTYGRAYGLWTPETGEFQPLSVQFDADTRVDMAAVDR